MGEKTKEQELAENYDRIEVTSNLCGDCDLFLRKDLCRVADCTTIDRDGNSTKAPAIYKLKMAVPA